MLALTCFASAAPPEVASLKLPQSVGTWKATGPKRVEPKAIFNYMDGAGELYIGYRFRFLDVYEYKSPSEDDILVELYWMDTPDDAWGLLSGDWGGERVELAPASTSAKPGAIRALYGAGLLRLWSGSLYARVMSYRETEASKQAVLAIGRSIAAGRPQYEAPRLVQAIPQAVGEQFSLKTDQVVFLRSHLVLNAAYFLAQENLLDLGLTCELASAVYRRESKSSSAKPVRMLFVRYADSGAARKALTHFQRVYLSGKAIPPGDRGSVAIEDGWLGFVISGKAIGLVFEAPDQSSTQLFLDASQKTLESLEVSK